MTRYTPCTTRASAQTVSSITRPSPLIAIENEAPTQLIVDPPLAKPLAQGCIFIQHRTENLRTLPVFGKGALKASPRIGHIHIAVDDAPWHFVDASDETIILLEPESGLHEVLTELAGPVNRAITSETVTFMLPGPQRGWNSGH
ncbi:DUF6130 family protein [Leptolyngbya sp. FACHB-16]|uniref:DUF6130 family protein n=1 Tax=unclassified Leptolyngbya TaxID=2650499 RepID=UPI0016831B71|nr:DUF6130 family protein [Leptolyngbya sp. FACHB-16]MBD2158780.1 hypothetical protein [Leptolyngbya sp. FACHB-16]